jgi:hypothetical protein
MRNALAISTMAVLLATIVSPGRTEERQSSVTVYTSPEINLGEIDREIIDQVGAGGFINFAAFFLERLRHRRRSPVGGASRRGYPALSRS